MKKITVRVVVPFPVMFSSHPGRAGDGDSVLECEVLARDEASALRKVERGIKYSVSDEYRGITAQEPKP